MIMIIFGHSLNVSQVDFAHGASLASENTIELSYVCIKHGCTIATHTPLPPAVPCGHGRHRPALRSPRERRNFPGASRHVLFALFCVVLAAI